MRNKIGNIVIGIVFVLVGFCFFGNVFFDWHFNIFFDGWWTLFIIVPCVISLIRHGFRSGALIGLGVGVVLFLSAQDFFDRHDLWKLLFPVILVAIGVTIIFGSRGNGDNNSVMSTRGFTKTANMANGEKADVTAIFSSTNRNFGGMDFYGAEIAGIFGGATLDLRGAVIRGDCMIEATAVFGGVDIFLPENINVRVNSTPIFGGVSNKATSPDVPDAPTLYIEATAVFGGVDLK